MKIALVDYGAGNLPSVERALGRLGAETVRARAPEELAGCGAIVLPGVGHFGALMRTLKERGLLAALRKALAGGASYLGICLGLQALFAASEEAPGQAGLGVLPGCIAPLPRTSKLPHMGWNRVRRLRSSLLLHGLPDDTYFYFAHSYAAREAGGAATAACDHGVSFVAALETDHIFAVQFHPEKSGEAGARVLRNFLECVGREAAP